MDPLHRTVLQVNEGFYRAFESGRIDEMERMWSGTDRDRCIHPGWPILEGWDAIRASWEGIFKGTRDIRIEIEQVSVQVDGDTATVTCVEHFSGSSGSMPVQATVAATNLYRLESDRWVMVLHHGSPLDPDAPRADGGRDRTLH